MNACCLDAQGYHQGRFLGAIPDAIIGCCKSILGIVVRPTAGMTEWVSKGTHGLGLVCLGRDAIMGTAQRRMRAPGSLIDEAPDVRPQHQNCASVVHRPAADIACIL